MPQNGAQQDVKTSTEGEVQADTGGTSFAAKQPQSSGVQDTKTSDKAAIRANVGKTTQPKVFSDIQGQLEEKSKNLQEEANNYVSQGKASQNYQIGQENLNKAISGDKGQSDSVRNLLGRQAVNPVSAFQSPDVEVRDANLVNTGAGLRELISRGQGPNYTRGMAAFDEQSIRKNPEFSNLMKMIQNRQGELRKQSSELGASKQREVQDYGAQQLAAAQKQARDYLGQEASSIDAANAAEAAVANQRLAQMRREGVGRVGEQAFDQAYQGAFADLQQADPRAAKQLEQSNFMGLAQYDPRTYATVRGDYGGTDFVDAQEAARFNSIMGLLGGGSTRQQSLPLGSEVNVDVDALKNALISGAQEDRGARDVKQRALIDKILGQGKAEAEKRNVNRTPYAMQQAAAAEARAVAESLGLPADTDVNYRDFYTAGGQLGASDVLTPAQLAKVNAAYKDLGDSTVLEAGANPAYTFNAPAYKMALQNFLEERRAQEEAANIADAESRYAQSGSVGGTLSDMAKQGARAISSIPSALGQNAANKVQDTPGSLSKTVKKFLPKRFR